MKLQRIDVYGFQFNDGCGTSTGEIKSDNGKYVRWSPHLEQAWDCWCDKINMKVDNMDSK